MILYWAAFIAILGHTQPVGHGFDTSVLNDNFSGYSNLGCRSLLFISLNISCQFLLAYKVSVEKSAGSLMETPL